MIFVPLFVAILIGAVMLGIGIFQRVSLKKKEGTRLIVIGGLLLLGSGGFVAFSLFVFASGM